MLAGCGDEQTQTDDVVYLSADGTVVIGWEDAPDTPHALGSSDPSVQEKVLVHVSRALQDVSDETNNRYPDGTSKVKLRLEVAPDAKWQHVQWLMQAAAHPGVRIWQVDARLQGEKSWTSIVLPKDTGLSAGGQYIGRTHLGQEYTKVKLQFFRKGAAAATKLRIDNGAVLDMKDSTIDKALEHARTSVKEKLPTDVVEIVATPPDGGAVPAADVLRVYRMVRDLGHETFLFEGTAPPMMQPHGG